MQLLFLPVNTLLFSITVYFQYHFVLAAEWLDSHMLYKVFPHQYFPYPPGTTHSYCNISDYIPCVVLSRNTFKINEVSGHTETWGTQS